MRPFDLIAFDADDTLWHTENHYVRVQAHFRQLLAPYHTAELVDERLFQAEMRNLAYFGYGVKGFVLSLIETAIDLSDGRISGAEVQALIDLAKEMVSAEVELIEGVKPALAAVAERYPLMLITKGDLFEQEAKIERSGLRPYFRSVEIVGDKTRASYTALLARHDLAPAGFLMVGNSLRSDVLPVVALGGRAVYIPYPLTWAHEHVDLLDEERGSFVELAAIGDLPGWLAQAQPPG
ncbi:MAG: HAD family hydrolase [Candidatus Promineifilaceae bacterium]